jgi:hypothetical protein
MMSKALLIFACLFLFAVAVYPAPRTMVESFWTTAQVIDGSIKQAAATTNYGAITVLVVAGTSKKAVIRCVDCADSLQHKLFTVNTGTLTLDISGVNGTLADDDSVGIWALLPTSYEYGFTESQVTWTIRWTTDGNWATAGAGGSGEDFWATRLAAKSVSGWTALTTNPALH